MSTTPLSRLSILAQHEMFFSMVDDAWPRYFYSRHAASGRKVWPFYERTNAPRVLRTVKCGLRRSIQHDTKLDRCIVDNDLQYSQQYMYRKCRTQLTVPYAVGVVDVVYKAPGYDCSGIVHSLLSSLPGLNHACLIPTESNLLRHMASLLFREGEENSQ